MSDVLRKAAQKTGRIPILAMALTVVLAVVTASSKAEAASYEKVLRRAKELGFIAHSESPMTWADAVAYCKQQGGKLPRISGMDRWDGIEPPLSNISIDGFGKPERPSTKGWLPVMYWTATINDDLPAQSWIVGEVNGGLLVISGPQDGSMPFAICVR